VRTEVADQPCIRWCAGYPGGVEQAAVVPHPEPGDPWRPHLAARLRHFFSGRAAVLDM